MAVFNEPTKWASTLGASADKVTIPDTAGETDPSIDKIFPSVFSLPLQKGGKAIPRTVLNGLFKTVGDWSYYQQNGGIASYNADFDYTVGRLVSYNGGLFKCIQDNAHTDPHNPTDKAFWAELADTDFSNVTNTAKIAMAHNAMPSDRYVDLTIGASGTQYTMPADGYVNVIVTSSASGPYEVALSYANIQVSNSAEGYAIRMLTPVKKGDVVTLNYNTTLGFQSLRFIYAEGATSEA
jgi:hypothetical protein